MGERVIKYIDLFAGMGGNRIALGQALEEKGLKGECVLTSEIKKHAVKVYKDNFNNEEVQGDICAIKSEDIPDFDYMLASLPCQSYSFAGKRKGLEDARGTLFFEVARILKDKQPKGFFIENVEGLVDHGLTLAERKKGKKVGPTLEFLVCELEKLGYKVTWNVLAASDFGVAQIRRRIYIVGHREEVINLENFEKKEVTFGEVQERGLEAVDSPFTRAVSKYLEDNKLPWSYLEDKTVRDKRGSVKNIHSWTLGLRGEVSKENQEFLEKMVTERRKKEYAVAKGMPLKDGLGLTISELRNIYDIANLEDEINSIVELGYMKKQQLENMNEPIYDLNGGVLSYEFCKILDPSKPCLTLVATDVGKMGVVDDNGLRHLTLKEGLRLNGYPEDYKLDINYRKGMDLLGNTVAVPVVKEVMGRLIKSE